MFIELSASYGTKFANFIDDLLYRLIIKKSMGYQPTSLQSDYGQLDEVRIRQFHFANPAIFVGLSIWPEGSIDYALKFK